MSILRDSSISDNRFLPIIVMDISASTSIESFSQPNLGESYYDRENIISSKYSDDINDIGWTTLEIKNSTPHDLDHYRIKSKLTDLLQKFKRVPFFHDSEQCADKGAVDNAIRVLHQMDEKMLPKVAVDEDGDIIFAWEIENRSVILTLEDDLWHFFEKEGSIAQPPLDEQSYVNGEISSFVWEKIPTK